MLSLRNVHLCAIATALLLTACQWDGAVLPSISEQPVLISPDTTYERRIHGVVDLAGLELVVNGDAVEARFIERDDGAGVEGLDALVSTGRGIAVRAAQVGTATVEVWLEGSLWGAFETTVAPVARVELEPATYAEVRGDFDLLAGERHLFSLNAYDADDRPFDRLPEVVSADPAVTLDGEVLWGGIVALTRVGSGPFSLEFTTGSGDKIEVEVSIPVQAIAPEEIVALQVEEDPAGGSFVARGVTADGGIVIGLPAAYAVEGQPVESVAGVYCPDRKPEQGTLQVTWNGLSVTL